MLMQRRPGACSAGMASPERSLYDDREGEGLNTSWAEATGCQQLCWDCGPMMAELWHSSQAGRGSVCVVTLMQLGILLQRPCCTFDGQRCIGEQQAYLRSERCATSLHLLWGSVLSVNLWVVIHRTLMCCRVQIRWQMK